MDKLSLPEGFKSLSKGILINLLITIEETSSKFSG